MVIILESIILAAGHSSRFNFKDKAFRKYFLPMKNSFIINYVIGGMVKAGVQKINIVVDNKENESQIIESTLNLLNHLEIEHNQLKFNFIQNDHSERENGYSLFLGLEHTTSKSFVLSMADHIFSNNIYSQLISNYNYEDILLATDPMKERGVYDLDDCTKVIGDNRYIKKIGKNLSDYNRLDMGVFIMQSKTVRNIAQKIENRKEKFGVSDIVISAIKLFHEVSYFDFPNTIWLDIDNEIEYNKLKRLFIDKTSKFFPFNLYNV